MHKFYHYFKLIAFSLFVLVGIQIPGFVSEYGKNLEARLAESKQSIQPFQNTADRHFEGDMYKLIAHYDSQNDKVLSEGGDGIKALFSRFELLNTSLSHFKESPIKSYTQTFLQPVIDIRNQVWKNYNFTILLSQESILFGFLFALALTIFIELITWFYRKVFKRNNLAYAN